MSFSAQLGNWLIFKYARVKFETKEEDFHLHKKKYMDILKELK